MTGTYDPVEPLAPFINQIDKGKELAIPGWKMISDDMIVSKGITLLTQTETFHDDISEWRQQSIELNNWANIKNYFHRAHI